MSEAIATLGIRVTAHVATRANDGTSAESSPGPRSYYETHAYVTVREANAWP
jgi:hypothetical protein